MITSKHVSKSDTEARSSDLKCIYYWGFSVQYCNLLWITVYMLVPGQVIGDLHFSDLSMEKLTNLA